jgi:hypothetical protein
MFRFKFGFRVGVVRRFVEPQTRHDTHQPKAMVVRTQKLAALRPPRPRRKESIELYRCPLCQDWDGQVVTLFPG